MTPNNKTGHETAERIISWYQQALANANHEIAVLRAVIDTQNAAERDENIVKPASEAGGDDSGETEDS